MEVPQLGSARRLGLVVVQQPKVYVSSDGGALAKIKAGSRKPNGEAIAIQHFASPIAPPKEGDPLKNSVTTTLEEIHSII